MIELKVRMYGIFRDFVDSKNSELHIQLPEGSNVTDLRAALVTRLQDLHKNLSQDKLSGLVSESVFASDTSILTQATSFKSDATISILPPVCGG